jgi:ABC-type proline/glycine betaine transport system ATPase subunit
MNGMAKAERKRLAAEWLQRVGLEYQGFCFPYEMSGGEQ